MSNHRINKRLEALERRLPTREAPADGKPYVPPPGFRLDRTLRHGDAIIYIVRGSHPTTPPTPAA